MRDGYLGARLEAGMGWRSKHCRTLKCLEDYSYMGNKQNSAFVLGTVFDCDHVQLDLPEGHFLCVPIILASQCH